jgi:SPP1 gp7 family putative phage head morphogenesis protein
MDPELDQTDEILTHTILILRIAAGLREDAIQVLRDLQTELLARLEDVDPDTLTGRRLRALLEQADESIAAAYEDIYGYQALGLKKVAAAEGKFTIATVNAAIGAPVISVVIPETLLEAIVDGDTIFGHPAKNWWRAQEEDFKFKFRGAIQQGVLQGEDIGQITRRIRGTKAKNFQDGIAPMDGLVPMKQREAEALARTATISVSNEARLRTMDAIKDVTNAIQWVSTLDSRTTVICRALSGLKWTLPDYTPIGHDKKFPGPTAHWNCRSTQVPVTKSWEELSGKKVKSFGNKDIEARMRQILRQKGWSEEKLAQVTARARASMGGPISQDVTMDQWMEGKSDSFLDQTLGAGRAKLFRDGKITMAELTDQNNRPLTLAELAKL